MLSIILSLASCDNIMAIAFLMKRSTVKLFSDMTIRKQLISWFDKRLIMSACNEEQGYKPRDAKTYLRNLLLPGTQDTE